jgi:hypothetical protein
MEVLVSQHSRFLLYKDIIQEQNKHERTSIIPAGKEICIMPFGAHSRGTIFEDKSEYINQELEDTIDKVAKQVYGFYI